MQRPLGQTSWVEGAFGSEKLGLTELGLKDFKCIGALFCAAAQGVFWHVKQVALEKLVCEMLEFNGLHVQQHAMQSTGIV